MTHGMRAPFLKLGECWWILNCHNSRGLNFSEILRGRELISLGRGRVSSTFLHISCYMFLFKNLKFSSISQNCHLQQSWAWHDPGTWGLCEGRQGKSLFTESYIFCHDSCWWPRTSGIGIIKRWGATISWGGGGWKMTGGGHWAIHNWALHHVFPILCQISEHFQYTLLTKLLGQFIEVQKSQFFQRLEILKWECISLFFQQHFEKLEVNLTL